MSDHDHREDRLLDRNLQMIGGRLILPSDPTPRQQAAWKQASTSSPSPQPDGPPSLSTRGVRFVRRHRLLTAATSAVAAGIVLAVLLVTPHGARVEASVILDTLRKTLLDGFQVTFERIGDEGVYVDGQVAVALRPAGTAIQHARRAVDPSTLEVESIYAEVRVRGDESDENKAGLDLQAVLALNDETQWAYLKMRGLPDKTLADEPLGWVLVGLTGSGLLLDFDGVRSLLDTRLTAAPAVAPTTLNAPSRVGHAAAAQNSIAQLVKDFLIGRAGADQIDRVLMLIAQTARDVRLAESEPGLHVLTVREFRLDALAAEDAAQLADMTLEVTYREGSGIESATLEHIGPYDGVLWLSPISCGVDERRFDQRNVIQPGVTTVWDLSSLRLLLERSFSRDK
jgi:hypothetical protein